MIRARTIRGLAVVLSCIRLAIAGSVVANDDLAEPVSIRVPAGFVVEQVAAPPLVNYPMLGAFDDEGRLFVCESAGLNLDANQLLDQLPNFVRMLEDTNGDGRFDKSTVFADKMTLPSGAMWHNGALYVASPPSIWRLKDTDGDGIADRRDELITGFNFRGHAGDVHGPYLGPNGRLFFVDGTMGHEIRDRSGQLLSKGNAARVFSSRLDGSDLESFCGGGMSNPVAVTFTEAGEMLVATTFFNYNAQERIRHDALFHAVYGGVYPRKARYLRNEFQLTGTLLPPLVRFGMSAPSNLTIYRSGAFGDDYLGNVFISHFNTRSVTRSRLNRLGATYSADSESFLVSTNPDFHPCDVIEDADGSLLVIDTGGWFKIGCPTNSLRPDALGAIYRIHRKDRPLPSDPRGLTVDWDATSRELVKSLSDDRFAVRDRAIHGLAQRGNPAIEPLRKNLAAESVLARRNTVWALTRIGTPAALAAARLALDDADPSVRLAAVKCAATHRDAVATDPLVKLLGDSAAAVRREAAMALGRIGQADTVPMLLEALENAGDRIAEHAIIFALIEINDPEKTRTGLDDPSAQVRRAALVALDQMDNSELTRDMISPLPTTDDPLLLEAVVDVVSRHPEWVEIVTGLLTRWLLEPELSQARRTSVRDAVYAFRSQSACQTLIAELLSQTNTPVASRTLLLDVMADGGFREFPATWQTPLLSNLESPDIHVASETLLAMASTDAGQFDVPLMKYAQDTTHALSLRVQAAGILSRNRSTLPEPIFVLLCSQCSQDTAFETRLEAARAIGNLELSSEQLDRVIDLVVQAGPLELPQLLVPLAGVWRDDAGQAGQRLVAVLEKSPGFSSLSEEHLATLFDNASSAMRSAAEPLFRRVKQEYATSVRQVLRTTWNLVGGDPVRGKQVFFDKRALCSTCHRVGPKLEKEIGPDLRRIGEVRSQRDLLEAILAPSASFARGFEPKTVVTTSGRVISGVIHEQTDNTIFLYTSTGEKVRIARSEVEEIVASQVSIMPRGLGRSLTSDELRDLLAYLSSLKVRELSD